ncbi:MAG: hypothetical protein ACRDZ6_08865, partial [Acidimicrobiales bacterium]
MALGPEDFLEGGVVPVESIPSRRERPPKDWAVVSLEGGAVVLELKSWRAVLAVRRRVVIDFESVVDVAVDPLPYNHVPTTLRERRRPHPRLWRLGVYRGFRGWSFWSCGMGRNAVVLVMDKHRFKYVVVEMADPNRLVAGI